MRYTQQMFDVFGGQTMSTPGHLKAIPGKFLPQSKQTIDDMLSHRQNLKQSRVRTGVVSLPDVKKAKVFLNNLNKDAQQQSVKINNTTFCINQTNERFVTKSNPTYAGSNNFYSGIRSNNQELIDHLNQFDQSMQKIGHKNMSNPLGNVTIMKDFQDKLKQSFFQNKFNQKNNGNITTPKINKIISKNNSPVEKIQYTIEHFGAVQNGKETHNYQQGSSDLILPWLGRMNLGQSLKPIPNFEQALKTMTKIPQIYLPFVFLPQMATAQNIPPGFEEFDMGGLSESQNFVEMLVEMNKNCILYILQQIHSVGIFTHSSGLAIIVWAVMLKLLTAPFFENALKYPGQMEMAVQTVIEAELNQDQCENDDECLLQEQEVSKAEQPQWTNPFLAQISPIQYNIGISLPMFFIETKSLIELARERPEFQQPFLWIPNLDGPTQDFGMNWMITNSLGDSMPYIAIHIFIIVQMVSNALIWQKMSVPDHSNNQEFNHNLDYAIAILVGSAALLAPATVTLNWYFSQLLTATQFFFMRAKLKKFDGLDLAAIRQKDSELRDRMGQIPPQVVPASEPELKFEFDQKSNKVMAKSGPANTKNETQRNFLKIYSKVNNKKKEEDEQI